MDEETEVELVEVSLYDKDGNPVEETPVVEAPAEEALEAEAADESEDEYVVPEKFKGKSLEDVIKAYENAEKELGRKNNEVGELRRLTDQILQNNQPQQVRPLESNEDETHVDFDDFVDDPEKAIEKALSRNPAIKKMEQAEIARKQEAARKALLDAHPDADDIVADNRFAEWLQERESRIRAFQHAAQTSDADTAVDLLDLYKQTRKAHNDVAVAERDGKAKAALKDAKVETGTNGASAKPVYSRQELIHMKIHDPARYSAMSAKIQEAYAEGRVKP